LRGKPLRHETNPALRRLCRNTDYQIRAYFLESLQIPLQISVVYADMGLQEIALAKEAEVNYGPFSFKWDQFVKSFFMHNKLMHSAMLSGPVEQKQGMMNMRKILELCRFYARDRSPLAWLHAMQIPAILKPLISAIVLSIFTELSMSSRLGEHYRHFAQTIPCLLRRFIIDLRYTSRIGVLEVNE
jgi:hypothetical protein